MQAFTSVQEKKKKRKKKEKKHKKSTLNRLKEPTE